MINFLELEFRIYRVLIYIFIFNLLLLESKNMNVNFEEMWENVVRDIFRRKSDILKDVLFVIVVIDDDLKNVLLKFNIVISELKFND